mmetsp:Transcript_27090/g.62778  ORF Transcript_27090/g.62778 Transcript_27090/m.62778 type:complete len:96 (-) Transcript_27090:315-602(-)
MNCLAIGKAVEYTFSAMPASSAGMATPSRKMRDGRNIDSRWKPALANKSAISACFLADSALDEVFAQHELNNVTCGTAADLQSSMKLFARPMSGG